MFDYSKLIGRIAEKHFTKTEVAEAIGVSGAAFRNKLSGRTQFKQGEIIDLVRLLGIDKADIVAYFFAT